MCSKNSSLQAVLFDLDGVIEDSAAGIEAAILGGMKSIGIGDENRLSKADYVISSTNGLSLKCADILFKKYIIRRGV